MLKPDIFLAAHTECFGFEDKQERAVSEGVEAWINPEEYRRFVAKQKRAFEDQADLEMGAPKPEKKSPSMRATSDANKFDVELSTRRQLQDNRLGKTLCEHQRIVQSSNGRPRVQPRERAWHRGDAHLPCRGGDSAPLHLGCGLARSAAREAGGARGECYAVEHNPGGPVTRSVGGKISGHAGKDIGRAEALHSGYCGRWSRQPRPCLAVGGTGTWETGIWC